MAHIEGEILIERPAEQVFDFVADERNEPRFNKRMTGVDKITAGPIGLGTQFRAQMKTMGRTAEMTIEFTGYQRPGRLSSVTHMPRVDIRGDLTFDPVPGGTRMRWSWEIETPGALRLVAPIITRTGERQERQIWTNLKHLLERERPGE